ncbi:dimethyl-ribityllumazine synthase [Zalerion maritima]|uniref:6,7-dimethyl-8-ribityllumazine synthase n=1 Tax=Zalerion maritima TaxID=339359 RepID=A0AAD5RUB0_9PEZI|nr:dimethyl-ribityllumazine synthase [Zalerion maritima]
MADASLKGAMPETHDGRSLRIGVVHARWNRAVIDKLVFGVRQALHDCNVPNDNIVVQTVPGSWELPGAAAELISGSDFDAIIAIGVLIKGETMHFEYIADAVSQGLMRVQVDKCIPVTFGVLTVLTEEQAMARAGMSAGGHNHGEDWGFAAVEMGLKRKLWRTGQFAKRE